MSRDEPPPTACELCGARFDDDIEALPPLVSIGGGAMARSVAQVYREAEKPRLDGQGNVVAPGVTNMNDRLRPGEVAGKKVENMVTQVADGMGMSPWGGAATQSHIAASKTGPASKEGNPALSAIQSRK